LRYQRVLLIQPDYPGSHYQTPTFPLGLGYIAESLKSASIEYKVVDMGIERKYSKLKSKVQDFYPDLIGISMMSFMFRHHYKLADSLKADFPNIHIVAGGPHISTFRNQVLRDCKSINYGVTLEGEITILELCKGVNIDEIKGLIFRKNDDITYTGDRNFITDLDSIPFPTYGGFEKYDAISMNVISSRGCPYSCIYCSVKLNIGQKLRVRSAKNVVDEIEYWYERGYRRFNFSDDNFTFYKDRVYEICDGIDRCGFKIEMNCHNGVRADKVDKSLLERMRSVGFHRIAFGVEAGTDRVLKNIKKGERLEEITKAIQAACDLGFEVTLFFLIGSPGEGPEDIEESFKIARRYNINDVKFNNLIPFPGTELHRWVSENNYFVRSPEEYFHGRLQWDKEPIFQTPTLSIKQRREAFKRGMSMGRKLRSAWYYKYYKDSLSRLRMFAPIAAYLASRNLVQEKLLRLSLLRYVRRTLKKLGIFAPQFKVSKERD